MHEPGLLHFQPAPFFADKNRAFWRLQILGWVGAALLRAVSTLASGVSWDFMVLVLITTITGFSISTILSVISLPSGGFKNNGATIKRILNIIGLTRR